MSSSTRIEKGTTIVDVVGQIDLGSSPALRKTLLESLTRNRPGGREPEAVKYIDSSGIASLLEVLKEARKSKKRISPVWVDRGRSSSAATHAPDRSLRNPRNRRAGARSLSLRPSKSLDLEAIP